MVSFDRSDAVFGNIKTSTICCATGIDLDLRPGRQACQSRLAVAILMAFFVRGRCWSAR